jgi:hypothetical protein
MIKETLIAIGTAARELFRNRGALAILNLLYAGLLAAVYMFFATREATTAQLALTATLALLAPLLFFILQAGVAAYAQGSELRPASLLSGALKNFWKVILVSLPVIALAVLAVYLLNRLQAYFPAATDAARSAPAVSYPQTPPPAPMRWSDVLLSTLRLLLLGVVLPLAAIHLWLGVARAGLLGALRKSPRILARAFGGQSVLAYAIGLFAFALMPYLLIFTRTPVKSASAELILFGFRLALAFVFSLWGWIITLAALAKLSNVTETTGAVVAPSQTGDAQTQTTQAQA